MHAKSNETDTNKEMKNHCFFYFVWLFFVCVLSRYLKVLRQHHTIFPTESLILIFSNIEKIFRFQQKFLDALRYGIDHNKIAEKFLEYVSSIRNLINCVDVLLCVLRAALSRITRAAHGVMLKHAHSAYTHAVNGAYWNLKIIIIFTKSLSHNSNLTLWFIQRIAIRIHEHWWNSRRTLAIWKRWHYWKSKERTTSSTELKKKKTCIFILHL